MKKEFEGHRYYWKDSILYQQTDRETKTFDLASVNNIRKTCLEVYDFTENNKYYTKLHSGMKQKILKNLINKHRFITINRISYISDKDGDIYFLDNNDGIYDLLVFSTRKNMIVTYDLFTDLLSNKEKYTEL